MAEVFKAKSYGVEGFEKIIAIKRILPTMGEDRDFIKMFIDEAKIAGQLAHANICQIFELGRIDGSHFIAMEYIWGKDLLQIQNRLRKIKAAMPTPMACFIIGKVLEGLDYAHRKRDPLGRPLEIVHRDCSPQNVLVSYEGEVKVIDFGIAKATSRNSRTMAGVLKGKFGYMSPEQVRGLPLDRRSDIFAIGTMLYECLTGERLFQGETDFSTLEKVRNVDIRPPREINPAIPEVIETIILKALAKDVDTRYQWCSEMHADLQTFLMAQDQLFTPKSLSGWLKEVFSTEIDRERTLLEQYKRVGRDGLIAGVPSAEAKLDVVENLGEAGQAEGDATQLGGPNFEDLDGAAAAVAAAAAPEIGPASGSPAATGKMPHDDDGDGDFGEEAPTEIFGEIDHGASPLAASSSANEAVTVPRNSGQGAAQPPKGPPKPPPGRGSGPTSPPQYAAPNPAPAWGQAAPHGDAGSGASAMLGASPSGPLGIPMGNAQPSAHGPMSGAMGVPMAAQLGMPTPSTAPPGLAPYPPNMGQPPQSAPGGYQPVLSAQGYPVGSHPSAQGNPYGSHPNHNNGNGLASPESPPQKTLLGAARPPDMPWYGAPGSNPSQQMAAQPAPSDYPTYQASSPGIPLPPQGYPSSPDMGGYAPPMSSPPYGQPGPGGPGGPYGAPQQQQPQWQQQQNPYGMPPAGAVEAPGGMPGHDPGPQAPPKKSSIARDVLIGVAIAAVVLGGFLAVKFLVLDKSDEPAAPTSTIANLRVALDPGTTAEVFVDDERKATVTDGKEIPVSPGKRKVRIVGQKGTKCEQDVDLAAGKTTTVKCSLGAATGSGSAAPLPPTKPANGGSGSAAQPAAAGSGSAAKPADAGSGSAAAKPADAGSGSAAVKPVDAGSGSAATKPADAGSAKTVDAGSAAKPADKPVQVAVKPADKPADKKPTDKKPADKPADKPVSAADKIAQASQKGYLQVYSKPSAKVSVDGKDTGMSTPVTGTKLALTPGKHKVTFVIGNDKHTFPVTIKAGETATLSKDLQ